MLNGYGRTHFENNDRYEGIFKYGKMNGRGIYHQYKSSSFIYAQFYENKIIQIYERGNDRLPPLLSTNPLNFLTLHRRNGNKAQA